MERKWPIFLTRSMAMEMMNLSRRSIERLVDIGVVRAFRTPGGHRRYFRDDLTKTKNGI